MQWNRLLSMAPAWLAVLAGGLSLGWAQEFRLELQPAMLVNEADVGDPSGILDEQRQIVGPPAGKPTTTWELNSKYWKQFPFSAHLDLGEPKNLSSLWLFDTNGTGDVVISAGEPGQWREVATYGCGAYLAWAEITLDVTTRYLRITRQTPGANFSEIAVYEYSDEAHRAMLQRKADEAQREAQRQAALARARDEALRRPQVELPPYGTLSLVDEIDCAAAPAEGLFAESPAGGSKVETILGSTARVLEPTPGEAAYFSYRLGRGKLLRPGGAYVLAVDYPEDAPRTMVVINTGNETARGFHTGPTVGDALHAKYVNSLPESLDVPLSGRWETWSLLFRLHDRFPPTRGLVRGPVPRTLTPEDGFDVTIAQFSAKDMPRSAGAAVRRIRLLEVLDPEQLVQPVALPPPDLPRRRLFWREEMADGIIDRKTDQPGIANPLDWYRYKAELMRFLGMNTYSKDLLEFGACQHWDSTPLGGNDWVFHDGATKHLWAEIVPLMGRYGFDVLPYYEYAGSKGYQGLGNQRRARPLTRDDAYTHISWVESANADVTDPDTFEDFRKMLELTVLRLRDQAPFAGVWLRPRGQLPVSFADAALARFATQTGRSGVTRAALREDAALYAQYLEWWGLQRRAFLVAIRDYLRDGGVPDALVLFTGCPGEPGVPFATWDPLLVTDQPEQWASIVQQPEHQVGDHGPLQPLTVSQVVDDDLYLKALTSPGLNWGNWEVHHSRPADDPQHYRETPGVLLTHAFNRSYTVASPRTLDAYRTPSGLALVRHYALNEHMMFDKQDKELLGYFVADIERAGPYCMLAEALAVARGDPTLIGYLVGGNFGRGFPVYVREFNAHFLALPALPSEVMGGAASDAEVVVRRIDTPQHGTWIAVVNPTLREKAELRVSLPAGRVTDAVSGEELHPADGQLRLHLRPCQLRSFRVR